MIRIKIEHITTRAVTEKKNYIETEEVAKDGQGNPIYSGSEYEARKEVKFNRTYKTYDEPRQVTDTVTLMEQTIPVDNQFNLAKVIMAINNIAGAKEDV